MWVYAIKVLWGVISFLLRRKKDKGFEERLAQLEARIEQVRPFETSPGEAALPQENLEQTLLVHSEKTKEKFRNLYKEGVELLDVRPESALVRLKKAKALEPQRCDPLFERFLELAQKESERQKEERRVAYRRWFEERSVAALVWRGLWVGALGGGTLGLFHGYLTRSASPKAEPLFLLGGLLGFGAGVLGGIWRERGVGRGVMLHSLAGLLAGVLLPGLALLLLLCWGNVLQEGFFFAQALDEPLPWFWGGACLVAGAFTWMLVLRVLKEASRASLSSLREGVGSGSGLAFGLVLVLLLLFFVGWGSLYPESFHWPVLTLGILLLVSMTLFGAFVGFLLSLLGWLVGRGGLVIYLVFLLGLGWLFLPLSEARSLYSVALYHSLEQKSHSLLSFYKGKGFGFFRARRRKGHRPRRVRKQQRRVVRLRHRPPVRHLTPRSYRRYLRQKILDHLRPPSEYSVEKLERLKGRVRLYLTLKPTGKIKSLWIGRSSGDEVFDALVLRAVRQATPFSPPPTSLQGQDIKVELR